MSLSSKTSEKDICVTVNMDQASQLAAEYSSAQTTDIDTQAEELEALCDTTTSVGVDSETELKKRKSSSVREENVAASEVLSSSNEVGATAPEVLLSSQDQTNNPSVSDTALLSIDGKLVLDINDSREVNISKVKSMLQDVDQTAILFYEMLVREYETRKEQSSFNTTIVETVTIIKRSLRSLGFQVNVNSAALLFLYIALATFVIVGALIVEGVL